MDFSKEEHIFRKKPVTIAAIQWTGTNYDEVKRFAGDDVYLENGELIIKTLEDGVGGRVKHAATVGDFVIRGVKSEYYFCKPDIFEQTYEVVE